MFSINQRHTHSYIMSIILKETSLMRETRTKHQFQSLVVVCLRMKQNNPVFLIYQENRPKTNCWTNFHSFELQWTRFDPRIKRPICHSHVNDTCKRTRANQISNFTVHYNLASIQSDESSYSKHMYWNGKNALRYTFIEISRRVDGHILHLNYWLLS